MAYTDRITTEPGKRSGKPCIRGMRITVSVSYAKAQLSRLLDQVYHGETVTIAKNNLPIADLVKHQPRGKRRLGLLRGQIVVPDDFTEEDPALDELFHPTDERTCS